MGLTLPKGDKSGRDRLRIRRKSSTVSEQSVDATVETEIEIFKGAPESLKKIVDFVPQNYDLIVDGISAEGETPIAIARNRKIIGIIRLKDVLKLGIKEKIRRLK